MSILEQHKQMQKCLRAYGDKFGRAAVRALIEKVAGVTAISQIPQRDEAAVIEACGTAPADAEIKPDDVHKGEHRGHWKIHGRA